MSMNAAEVVNTMMKNDTFSQWLGIEVLEIREGYCKLGMTVKENMLNGFGIAHGGISYSLADSALAFASNSWGRKSVSIDTSISHLKPLNNKDEVIAEAICENQSEKLGHYAIKVYLKAQPHTAIALFRGTVYRTSKIWE
ncbi:MAG: hotdog fold thioesterase [Bacteroidia bacterium]|nr:hotdog fold thioesterase [Bacteroidia bacterium]